MPPLKLPPIHWPLAIYKYIYTHTHTHTHTHTQFSPFKRLRAQNAGPKPFLEGAIAPPPRGSAAAYRFHAWQSMPRGKCGRGILFVFIVEFIGVIYGGSSDTSSSIAHLLVSPISSVAAGLNLNSHVETSNFRQISTKYKKGDFSMKFNIYKKCQQLLIFLYI